jgi:uncharacterized spore protein YtfJ
MFHIDDPEGSSVTLGANFTPVSKLMLSKTDLQRMLYIEDSERSFAGVRQALQNSKSAVVLKME